ncbi:APO protein 3, mitochondrial-like [Aristolochia californica]|uniref:APO protein 3, mitochondrial-like n=1 Tax=Aristolochia californica TaxID=171875 RepID=UPI0035DF6C11
MLLERVCGEVHVGLVPHGIRTSNSAGSLFSKEHSWIKGGINNILPVVESFHLYDRVGRAVSHEECLEVDRIPAVVELCVQAGLDLAEYRRVLPVYNISGRIIDFEKRFPQDAKYGENIKSYGFWENITKINGNLSQVPPKSNSLQGLSMQGMQAWDKMRYGALRLIQNYPVQTCGYCPEVQVGPKGHRVRLCQAFKHQMRDGQHAWQEASIDDLVPPVYVWHVKDPQHSEPLVHSLKRYYGKLPAVVELFWQGGDQVGEGYDVVVPDLKEEKLVVADG